MFGRKRKKEEDGLGLSAPVVSSALNVTPSTTPTPTPAPTPAAAATFPTTVPGMLSQILGGNGPISEMISQIKADPQGFRERMMQQAQAAGISTYVMTPHGMTPSVGQHVDVVDELTKAAALHDKGALTDAEFEALKKKLLAE